MMNKSVAYMRYCSMSVVYLMPLSQIDHDSKIFVFDQNFGLCVFYVTLLDIPRSFLGHSVHFSENRPAAVVKNLCLKCKAGVSL